MAKDRNTYAKHQREAEKKRKANQKRDRRARKKHKSDESTESNPPDSTLSLAEHKVLRAFRESLMTPGEMLCFSGAELNALSTPLAQLTDKGLLVAEESQGAYYLIPAGLMAIRRGEQPA